MKKLFSTIGLISIAVSCHGQDSTRQHAFSVEFLLDSYLQLTSSAGAGRLAPGILFNYKRQNEPSLNLFLTKLKWEKGHLQLNAGLMAGDYGRYNLASEPAIFRHVYELYLHYRISEKLSADAGILNSHIGLESVPAGDNWNAARSILAENSPYYETGFRLDFQPNEKWRFSTLLLNGWQHIRDNNKAAAIGTQVQYRPSSKILFNLSGFAGNEEKLRRMPARYFLDLYCTTMFSDKTSLAFMMDAGLRKVPAGNIQDWGGAALLFRQRFTKWLSAAARAEYFSDPHQVVSTGFAADGFKGTGYSVNTDFQLNDHALFRLEGRILHTANPYFTDMQGIHRTDQTLLVVLSFRF